MTPISSICPANISRGVPSAFRMAKEFPATSASTASAKRWASALHARAGAVSKEEGPGVSSRVFRNAIDSGVTVRRGQWQLEKDRARNRVLPVRRDVAEPELPV